MGFDEIAQTIQRDPAACRQLAARARTHVRESRPRFQVEKQRGLEIARAFYSASRGGDLKALGAMLAADVSLHADGGGKRPAVTAPLVGYSAVMGLFAQLTSIYATGFSTLVRVGFVNGLPGFVTREGMASSRRRRWRSRMGEWKPFTSCGTRTS